jgi:hypothetical protein
MLVRFTAVALLAATFTTAVAYAQEEGATQTDQAVEPPQADAQASESALSADAPMEPAAPGPLPITVARPAPVKPTTAYGVWDRLAQCESSGNWHANTGNGYYGGVQEDMTFWHNYGYDVDHPGALMAARPDLATPGQQVIAAERGLKAQGWGAWPSCSRRLGLR